MTENPWAAWLREQEGAQVLPGGAEAAPAVDAAVEERPHGEFRGGPFGWDLAARPERPRRHLLVAAVVLWVLLLLAGLAVLTRPFAGSSGATSPAEMPALATEARPAPAQGAGLPAEAPPAADVPPPAAEGAPLAAAEGTPPPAEGALADSAAEVSAGAEGVPADSADEVPVAADGAGGRGETEAAGEAGALLVRAALGAPAGSGGAASYVDAAVVTGVEPAGEAQVVSVLALVLSGDGEGWDRASVQRHAVAVVRDADGSYRAVAGPWALAAPAEAAPAGTPETDPERIALATQALERAGYRDVTGLSLLRDPAHPGVLQARTTAVAPGAATAAAWTLWLRDAPTPALIGTG